MSHTSAAAPRSWIRSAPYTLAAALGGTALIAVPAPAAAAEPAACAGLDAHRGAQRSTPAPVTAPQPGVSTLAAPVRTAGQVTYRVRAGDTVGHIALRLGVSSASLISANGLRADGFIREGQVLVVSGGAVAPAAPAAPATASYVVRRGDTLSHIAARSGTTVAALIAANQLPSNGLIREGQKLSIPGGSATSPSAPAAPAAPTASTTTYTVRSGDTLSHIAARSGTTLAAIRSANPGLADTLQIGQRIALPGTATAPVGNTFAGRTYAPAVVSAAQANKDALAARSVPSRAQMQAMVAATARQHGVDPALAQAIAFQESGFNMRAVSPANAVGVMQVTPSAGTWMSELSGRRLDLLDPQDNVTAGVLLLRVHLRSGATQENVIAAYYQGMSSVKNNGMYPDTRRYVASVQTLMARYR